MRVYGFTNETSEIMEIENTLEAEQTFVGGYIEVVRLTEELDLVCNEEGKNNGLKPTVAWIEEGRIIEIIAGNCFICRHNKEDFTSIQKKDVKLIKEKLKEIISIAGSNVYLRI